MLHCERKHFAQSRKGKFSWLKALYISCIGTLVCELANWARNSGISSKKGEKYLFLNSEHPVSLKLGKPKKTPTLFYDLASW